MTLIDSKREEEMTDDEIREIAESASERAAAHVEGNMGNNPWPCQTRESWVRFATDQNIRHLTEAIRILSEAGYAVVPVEPTEEMSTAGMKAWCEDTIHSYAGKAALVYTAMIRARKTP